MLELKESQTLHLRIKNNNLEIELHDKLTTISVGFKVPISEIKVRKKPFDLIDSRIITLQYHLKTFNFGFLYGSSGRHLAERRK